MKKSIIFFLLVFLLLAAVPAAAAQDEAPAVQLTAEAGFDGYYKTLFWLPVQITVSNSGPAIEGAVQVTIDSGGLGNELVYSSPISLPTQSNKRVTLYVYLPDFTSNLTVVLVDDRGREVTSVRSNTLEMSALDDILYGIVSPEPGELDFLEDVQADRGDADVAFLNSEDLPDSPAAWQALDVLVLHDVDTGQFSAEQLAALNAWVSGGGQLVVSGGPGWQKTTAAVADLLPVTVSGSQSVADLPDLQTRTGAPFNDPGPYVVTTSTLQRGELIYHQDGLPLLAGHQVGRGHVFFLALDPNLAPLLDWDGNELLWGKIAESVPRLPTWGGGPQNGFAATSAVSSLPSLALPSAIGLIFFLLLYVAAVGPLNYFVLRRRKRRELAWVTIPALVLFFSVLAYVVGFQLKGNDIILNQMSVAYGQADAGQMRVQSLLGIYSPRRATYDLVLPSQAVVRPFERSYGGSLSGAGNLESIERGNELIVRDLRIDVSDIETLIAESYQPGPSISGEAVLRLQDRGFWLDVQLQNNSELTLERAVVLIGTNAILLGDLAPGEIADESMAISRSQATAAASGFSGPGYIPSGSLASPINNNYEVILGSGDYYDADIYPRWQLLQALSPEYGPATVDWYPQGIATLVFWSDARQLEIELSGEKINEQSTTLYFLELPFTQTIANGENITLPQSLVSWSVLAESGIYDPTPTDLYMPPGWVEFEFQPWPEFQSIDVTELELTIHNGSSSSQPLPRVQLWDWQEEQWDDVSDLDWGATPIVDWVPLVGPGAKVRVRIQNSDTQGIEISEVFPELTGNID